MKSHIFALYILVLTLPTSVLPGFQWKSLLAINFIQNRTEIYYDLDIYSLSSYYTIICKNANYHVNKHVNVSVNSI